MNDQHAQGLTEEGPRVDQLRIIGVELTITDPWGTEHELEMFSCKHTLLSDYRYVSRYRVTLHTSQGDITHRGSLRPGNTTQSY